MYCDNCGAELREDARFCPRCGTRFVTGEENVTEDVHAKKIKQAREETYKDRFVYDDNPAVSANGTGRKSKNKLIIILPSVIAGLIAVTAIVFVIVSLNTGITADKAYQKYFQVLENDREKVVAFEKESGANGVAVTDINSSGVPDVLYITKDEEDSDSFSLHSVLDNGKDFETDNDVSFTGPFSKGDVIFQTEGDKSIYILSGNNLRKLEYIKDGGKYVLRIEVLATRTYDEETDEYTYFVFYDTGESIEVSKNDYDAYIAERCKDHVTIILSTLSDEELKNIFPDAADNISDSCDEAIEKLKKDKDIAPVGQDNTDPEQSDDNAPVIQPTEVPEEKNKGFVCGGNLVEYNDVVYYVDDNGLWKKEPGADSKLLHECSAKNLATDGKEIYYGVFHETVSFSVGKTKVSNEQYDLYLYDLKTGTNEKVVSFNECGKPICAVEDIVYYTDYPDGSNQNRAGLSQYLYSYDKSTEEKVKICDGAHLVDTYNGKIFYRALMAAGGNYGVHQIHCYDTATGESEIISDDNVLSFKVIADKLYYEITSFSDFKGDAASNQIQIYSYDISSGETKKLFEKNAQIKDILFYDDQYIFFSEKDALIRYSIEKNEEETIPPYILDGSNPEAVWHFNNETLLAAKNESGRLYKMDDDSMEVTGRTDSFVWRTVATMKDNMVFTVDKGDNNFYFYTISLHEIK